MPTTLLSLGDSTSVQAPPSEYQEYLYKQLISENIDVQFVGSANGAVVNGVTLWLEGHPGFQTYQLAVEQYIPNAFPKPWPDVINLMIGVNDLFQLMTAGLTAAQAADLTTRRLQVLIERIFRLSPNVRLFVAQIAPTKIGMAWDFVNPGIVLYNANIPAVVSPWEGRATVVDCWTGYDAANWFSINDPVHPDERGARFVAKRHREYGCPR